MTHVEGSYYLLAARQKHTKTYQPASSKGLMVVKQPPDRDQLCLVEDEDDWCQ